MWEGACLWATLRVFVDGQTCLRVAVRKFVRNFDVLFVAFPVNRDVIAQILWHVLDHGFGKGD